MLTLHCVRIVKRRSFQWAKKKKVLHTQKNNFLTKALLACNMRISTFGKVCSFHSLCFYYIIINFLILNFFFRHLGRLSLFFLSLYPHPLVIQGNV